jgi:hypothetical protein
VHDDVSAPRVLWSGNFGFGALVILDVDGDETPTAVVEVRTNTVSNERR